MKLSDLREQEGVMDAIRASAPSLLQVFAQKLVTKAARSKDDATSESAAVQLGELRGISGVIEDLQSLVAPETRLLPAPRIKPLSSMQKTPTENQK